MRVAIRRSMSVAVVALSLVVAAFAFAPIDGTWVGTMNGPDGPGPVRLELKSEGTTLTGTMDLFGMITPAISNGKISADSVWFDLVIAEADITLPFAGKLEGEKLNLNISGPGGAETIVFSRPAPAN